MARYGVTTWEIFSVSFSRPIAEDEKKSATIFQLLNDVISARSSLEYRFKTRWLSFILICTKHHSAKILQWKTQFESGKKKSGANVFEFGRVVVVLSAKMVLLISCIDFPFKFQSNFPASTASTFCYENWLLKVLSHELKKHIPPCFVWNIQFVCRKHLKSLFPLSEL